MTLPSGDVNADDPDHWQDVLVGSCLGLAIGEAIHGALFIAFIDAFSVCFV